MILNATGFHQAYNEVKQLNEARTLNRHWFITSYFQDDKKLTIYDCVNRCVWFITVENGVYKFEEVQRRV